MLLSGLLLGAHLACVHAHAGPAPLGVRMAVLDSLPANSGSRVDAARQDQLDALTAALTALRKRPGWDRVTSHRTLELGDSGAEVVELARRLDVATGTWLDAYFDPTLETAVKRYQATHGLDADGIVGRRTREHLNVPIDTRIAQVERAMASWQRLPVSETPDYVWVNIPEYTLRVFDDHREMLNMRVVVGKPSSPTPVMVEELEYLMLNPYWDIPRTISRHEILPKIQADPTYVSREQLDVVSEGNLVDPASIDWSVLSALNFPFSLRQRPGPNNSLGQVKFIFPNPEFIYLHDTPSKHAFNQSVRTFSHGCVRVEDSITLAKTILSLQNGGSHTQIEGQLHEMLNARRPTYVPLEEKLPVFITYQTVTVQNGALRFLSDVYDLDRHASPSTRQTVAAHSIQPTR